MQQQATLILVLLLAQPAFAKAPVTHMVTVAQLEEVLARPHHGWDGMFAKRISQMKLTQRPSDSDLIHLEAEVHGRQSRAEITALADEAVFLDLPPSEVPPQPPPDPTEQAAILTRSVRYVRHTVGHWPDLEAEQVTTQFAGTASVLSSDLQDWLRLTGPSSQGWNCKPRVNYRRLSTVGTSTVEIVYLHGHEIHSIPGMGGEFECDAKGLSTLEDLTPDLTWVSRLITDHKVAWSHWENGSSGVVAVFHYSATLLFRVHRTSRILVNSEGQIAINPATGAVLRVTDLRHWAEPVTPKLFELPEFGTMTEYAPVRIGQTTSMCR